MKNLKYIPLLFILVLILSGCGNDNVSTEDNSSNKKADSVETETFAQENVFGDFASQTLEGEEVTQEIFAQADLTMVNIWGTFCGPCIQEMPDLGELNREYSDRGFQIVGMLCDVYEPGDETALEIVNETQADYQHLVASKDLINGTLQRVSVVPTTYFVDSEGNQVGDVYAGSRDKEGWSLIIEQLLSQVQ